MQLSKEEMMILYVAGVYYVNHGSPGLDKQDNPKLLRKTLDEVLTKLEDVVCDEE